MSVQAGGARLDDASVRLGANRHDPPTQIFDLQHIHIGRDGMRLVPIRLRLAALPEFDLMRVAPGSSYRRPAPDETASRSTRAADGTSASTGCGFDVFEQCQAVSQTLRRNPEGRMKDRGLSGMTVAKRH